MAHGVKEITEAMIKQTEKGSFVHGSQFTSDSVIAFAERIVRIANEYGREVATPGEAREILRLPKK